jgi:hypothetical protein
MASRGLFLYLTNYKPTPGSRASSYRPQTPSVCRFYLGYTFDKRMPMLSAKEPLSGECQMLRPAADEIYRLFVSINEQCNGEA